MDSLIYNIDVYLSIFTNYIISIFEGSESFRNRQHSIEYNPTMAEEREEPTVEEQHKMQEDARDHTITGELRTETRIETLTPEQMAMAYPKKRKYTEDVLLARTQLLRSNFPLEEKTRKTMQQIRDILADAAEKIVKTVKETGEFDMGRLIHAIDTMQVAKNVAIESILLPQAPM